MKIKFLFPLLLLLFASVWIVSPAKADEIALAQTVQASQTAEYQIELRNDTAADHEYSLSLSGLPEILVGSFTQGGPRLEKITVPANSYGQVTLHIEVPADTPIGHYTAEFSATREDGQTLIYPLSLTVENTYALQIASQSLNLNTFSGQEFSFDVTAANRGAAPVTNLALAVEAPQKWIVTTDPATLPNLEPGTETTIHARVLVPASQVASDQSLKLVLTSDQTTSPESALTVRVQKSPTFFYVALGLMALAVGGVFLYFRSKGRR